ncbi:DUF5004 domain-containing protein [Antarcticibacterium arcticum]|uniref:DUF5004 domain-containing protein n=1 Tax=Antarcticibacterium arcticum TaxID=2585771 RepID=A0A5B8YNE4_9FLAO|nr:lipocalin family protein [Antarcticibacterium arcticum]QED38808.1 DUF5004 domain-containing protein [Antarcticibacterium arcticum]
MKKFIKNSILLSLTALLFSACSGEDFDDKDAEALDQKMLTYIETADLVGHWDLSVLRSNIAVDLNADGTSNTNLLEETTCFDVMNIDLKDDMTFTSVNSRMDFAAGETNDAFACMAPRTDVGTWDVQGDTLTLNVNIAGSIYTHTKKLTMGTNTFSFDVEKWESEQYVKDPGNTVVSGITIMSQTYTRS